MDNIQLISLFNAVSVTADRTLYDVRYRPTGKVETIKPVSVTSLRTADMDDPI